MPCLALRLIWAQLAAACCCGLALASHPAGAATAAQVPQSKMQMQLSFAPLVKEVAPAVVNVYVTQRVKDTSSLFNDPFFQEFFGGDFGAQGERVQNSLGSGILVSEDGVIVTNNHVVKSSGEAEIRVALADKREFDAKIILRDDKLDLAVLRISGASGKFPYLQFDDSDRVEVGDLVLAIGDPFGIGQTVTSGIVSALARTGIGNNDSEYFIQTDAAINPGNSGGALVDMSGRVIGINTAIVSRSGGSHGIGFAIPANLVKPFVESAITGKEIKKPWLGAKLEAVTSQMAQALGLEKVEGALVSDVYPDSPAAKAGLVAKDVVVSIDDHDVADPGVLSYHLATKGVGKTARLKILRDGKEMQTDLVLAEAPGINGSVEQVDLSGAHPFDGVRVALLSPALADQLGLGTSYAGVVVVDVQPGSIAQGLGIRPGDVVMKVNRSRIKGLDDLERALASPQRLWRLDVKRGDRVYQMAVPG